MSTVACRNCSAPNPAGSKFCNNCGTPLPPSTKLICPNCKTANPRDLLYCDNCGTRLVQQQPAQPPAKPKVRQAAQEPESEEPAAPAPRAFSLPSRQSGSAIDLDIHNLPDWLRSDWAGEESASPPASPPIGEKGGKDPTNNAEILGNWLSELEDTTAEPAAGEGIDWLQETTAGTTLEETLPDWMRETEAGQPAEASAQSDFPDWLQETQIDQPAASLTADDLPDWLAQATAGTNKDQPTAIESGAGDDLPDWLAAMNTPTPMTTEAGAEAQAEDGYPNWWQKTEPEAAGDSGDDVWPFQIEAEESQDRPAAELYTQETSGVEPVDWLQGDIEAGPANEYDDLPDWLKDASFSPADSGVKGGTDELSQWLVDAMESGAATEAAPPSTPSETAASDDWQTLAADDDMPDWLRDVQTLGTAAEAAIIDSAPLPPLKTTAEPDEPDWLNEELGLDEETAASIFTMADDDESDAFPDWLSAVESPEVAEAAPPQAFEPELPSPSDDLPDWIKEMAPRNTGLLKTGSLPPVAEPAVEDDMSWLADVGTEAETKPATGPMSEIGLPDALPDWLADLAPPDIGSLGRPHTGPLSPSTAKDKPPSTGELDWLADLLPADSGIEEETPPTPRRRLPDWPVTDTPPSRQRQSGSLRPPPTSPLTTPPTPPSHELEGVPLELASAELPDWLMSELGPPPGPGGPNIPVLKELPAWLDSPEDEGDQSPETLLGPPPTGQAGAEWQGVLGDLPPAAGPAIVSIEGDIPAWLQALRPRALTAEGQAELITQEPAPTTGPLAGLRGAIEIEAVAAQPHQAKRLPSFTVTKDQQHQVTLLRQLVRDDQKQAVPVDHRPAAAVTWQMRLALSVLLLLAVGFGSVVADLLPTAPPPLPAAGQHFYDEVSAIREQPVLVVFDYSPAMAGELDPQAEMLIKQLEENGNTAITASQFAAGIGIAEQKAAGSNPFLIPGEAIGLRSFAGCLEVGEICQTVGGEEFRPDLSNVRLIILLTGDQDSLVGWVEQVASQTDKPVVAAVTQAIAPVALTYATTEQLDGVITGLSAAAAYESQYWPGENDLNERFAAQAAAQWLVIILLIGGNVIGLLYWLRPRPGKGGTAA